MEEPNWIFSCEVEGMKLSPVKDCDTQVHV